MEEIYIIIVFDAKWLKIVLLTNRMTNRKKQP
jgi:hypothetical protein